MRRKYYTKCLYPDMEVFTINDIKQKIIDFEAYFKKQSYVRLQANLNFDRVNNQYHLCYYIDIPKSFRTAETMQDFVKKLNNTFKGILCIHAEKAWYIDDITGQKKNSSHLIFYTTISENWLKEHWPEYLEKFETIDYKRK